MAKGAAGSKAVTDLKHEDVKRKNIPTAEYESILTEDQKRSLRVAFDRRNKDLDPQLVWRGKDEQDWSDLVVQAPPLYIQEKVHPKALIDDLLSETRRREHAAGLKMADLFADFNGIPVGADKTEFYLHDQNWSNRMILGDSLQVMASLAEREGLREKVQCIYFDPPYGIKFNSNFQWSTTSRDVKDGSIDEITREPEQVKAFRDTWRDGVHSYLTYLRDRLTVARDLLADSGSLFVQIGDENVHRVRALLDEVFGDDNFVSQISFVKAGALGASGLPRRLDYILWFGKNAKALKFRSLLKKKSLDELGQYTSTVNDDYTLRPLSKQERQDPKSINVDRLCRLVSFTKPGPGAKYPLNFEGGSFLPGTRWWGFPKETADVIVRAGRLRRQGASVASLRYWNDFAVEELSNLWSDTASGSAMDKIYVVQTNTTVIERCVLMSTDPGDLVLDPTCGSGTTAYVSEQWGRRWITTDTSRVALALARTRMMAARYPFYILADSREGQLKESELANELPSSQPVYGKLKHGFVYERVPHVTLKAIANNSEIDVIWDKWQGILDPLRLSINNALHVAWDEWDIPNQADAAWSKSIKEIHAEWRSARISRQREIDKSIASKAEYERLYDQPFEEKRTVRLAGPFTVESLSPHRMLAVGADEELIDPLDSSDAAIGAKQSFPQMILQNLRIAGVQQAHRDDKIVFDSLTPWPGTLICAEGRYLEGDKERRAGIFIGDEFGTVTRPDLVEAAREAGDAAFDVLIACAFNYEAHATEFSKLGRIAVLKARMNADLHMSDDLKNTGKGNLFVIFGEPDISIVADVDETIRVKVNGVDVFHPNTGEVRSDSIDGIACWFVDTDYNQESFFVRQAYFLGANDQYGALRSTLKGEIDSEAWASLNSDCSRAFAKPKSGRIAVKVINNLGDEVMKVFKVS